MATDAQNEKEDDPQGAMTNEYKLLKEWKLDQYEQKLRENGYNDYEDWEYMTKETLLEIGFKLGHADKFLRKIHPNDYKKNNNNNNSNEYRQCARDSVPLYFMQVNNNDNNDSNNESNNESKARDTTVIVHNTDENSDANSNAGMEYDEKKENMNDDMPFLEIGINETESDYGKIDETFECPDFPNNPSMCPGVSHLWQIPFAQGVFKYAFLGHYCGAAKSLYGKKIGQRCVIKKWKLNANNENKRVYDSSLFDCEQNVYNIAKSLINKWNEKESDKYGINKLVLVECVDGFHDTEALKGEKEENFAKNTMAYHERIMTEDYLPGKFVKWNSNSGWHSNDNRIVQTFCHWTWVQSGYKYLYCDAQGIKKGNEYLFSDPCIMSLKEGQFGVTDLGPTAIAKWLTEHDCTLLCDKTWKKFDKDSINWNDCEIDFNTVMKQLKKFKSNKRTTYRFESWMNCKCGGIYKKNENSSSTWYEKICDKCHEKIPVFDIRDK